MIVNRNELSKKSMLECVAINQAFFLSFQSQISLMKSCSHDTCSTANEPCVLLNVHKPFNTFSYVRAQSAYLNIGNLCKFSQDKIKVELFLLQNQHSTQLWLFVELIWLWSSPHKKSEVKKKNQAANQILNFMCSRENGEEWRRTVFFL